MTIFSDGSSNTDFAVLNVKSFGAVGDGVTDDTASIQATITAASGEIFDGDWAIYGKPIIYLPPGIYKITNELVLKDRLIFTGAGRAATRIFFQPSGGAVEGLAAISAKGGPTSNDYIWEPEIKNLSITMDTVSQTANERYGIYLLYPTRAVVENVQISCSTVSGQNWVGLRTGREQGTYSNLLFNRLPVSIYLDTGDNASFRDIVYLNGTSTPSTLPRTAIYASPTSQIDRVVFGGKQVVAGFNHVIHWHYSGSTGADGIYMQGLRSESPTSTSGYRFDFGGTSFIRNIVIRDAGVTGNSHLFRGGSNTLNMDIDCLFFEPGSAATGKTAFNIIGLHPSNYNYFSARNCYILNNTSGTISQFAGGYQTTAIPERLDSNKWVLFWFSQPTVYAVNSSFSNYATANSSAHDLDDLTVSGIHNGHEITIFVDPNTTVKDNATQMLASGADFNPATSGIIKLQMRNSIWREISRSIF